MRKWFAAVGLTLLFVLTAGAQDRGPSTAEERAQAVRLTRLLESDPLNGRARDARSWLTMWIASVPDITVTVCGAFLGPLLTAKRNYSAEIFAQSMYSSAAFVIEHPEQKDDEAAKHLAGLEGSLRAYEAIRKVKPKVKWPIVDELIASRDAGQLAEYVRGKMPACSK